jgi:hypothetical protein
LIGSPLGDMVDGPEPPQATTKQQSRIDPLNVNEINLLIVNSRSMAILSRARHER